MIKKGETSSRDFPITLTTLNYSKLNHCAVKLNASDDADELPPRYIPWNAVVGLLGS